MAIDLEYFPVSETAREMLEYVTKGWYDRAYVGKWLYQVMGLAMDQVKQIYEELPDQFFVETATWGLAYHEQKYGLPVKENVAYEERRRAVLQRMKSRVPMCPYQMERLLQRQLGVEAEVTDVHDPGSLGYEPEHPNVFQVIIWDREQNTSLDYGAVERQVRQVNQSHTAFTVAHRQVFNHTIRLFAGAVVTEWVGYDIKARQMNRDVEAVSRPGAAVVIDISVMEEIRAGGLKNGSKQR